jgi:hypothetical protein
MERWKFLLKELKLRMFVKLKKPLSKVSPIFKFVTYFSSFVERFFELGGILSSRKICF